MRGLSVRLQLTIWYLLVASTGLLVFGILSFSVLRFALIQGKKSHLRGREVRLIQFLEENRIGHTSFTLSEQLRQYTVATHEGNLFDIRGQDGKLLFPLDASVIDAQTNSSRDCSDAFFFFQKAGHQSAMVMCHTTLLNGIPVRLFIGGYLDEEFYILRVYRNALLLLAPGLLSISAITGYLLSRHALKSVDRMTKAAVNIGIGNLSARLPVPSANDEIQHLAVAWNQLLGRVEAAVLRLSKFSEDVSHDLRTSITIILATAQLSLQRIHSEDEYREDLNRVVAECRTASTLLDALLSLARSETFSQEVAFERINICELVVTSCRRVEDLADSRKIILDWHLPEEAVFVEGDEILLQRLLGVLLDNAIKFTPAHGEVNASVSKTANDIVVTVSDTGIGIAEDVRQRIFERYYQADLRERKTQAGNGLGLAIARWIADAHQAVLAVESASPGAVFQIRFPFTTDRFPGLREQLL